MTNKTDADRQFDAAIADILAKEDLTDVQRSALILQRMLHRDWMAWIAMHADGTMGGGRTAVLACAEIIGTMIAELAVNLTQEGKDPKDSAAIMFKRAIVQCLSTMEAHEKGEAVKKGYEFIYDFTDKQGLN